MNKQATSVQPLKQQSTLASQKQSTGQLVAPKPNTSKLTSVKEHEREQDPSEFESEFDSELLSEYPPSSTQSKKNQPQQAQKQLLPQKQESIKRTSSQNQSLNQNLTAQTKIEPQLQKASTNRLQLQVSAVSQGQPNNLKQQPKNEYSDQGYSVSYGGESISLTGEEAKRRRSARSITESYGSYYESQYKSSLNQKNQANAQPLQNQQTIPKNNQVQSQGAQQLSSKTNLPGVKTNNPQITSPTVFPTQKTPSDQLSESVDLSELSRQREAANKNLEFTKVPVAKQQTVKLNQNTSQQSESYLQGSIASRSETFSQAESVYSQNLTENKPASVKNQSLEQNGTKELIIKQTTTAKLDLISKPTISVPLFEQQKNEETRKTEPTLPLPLQQLGKAMKLKLNQVPNEKIENPQKITVQKQIDNLEPYWRFGGRLAGERSESSNAGVTESQLTSELYGTESVVTQQRESQINQLDSVSGKAQKNNVVIGETASDKAPDVKTVQLPANAQSSLNSQVQFKGSIGSKNKVSIDDDKRSINTFNLQKQFAPMALPRQTIDSEKALSAMDQLYMDTNTQFDPKALKQEIADVRRKLALQNNSVKELERSHSQSQRSQRQSNVNKEDPYSVKTVSKTVTRIDSLPQISQKLLSKEEVSELKLLEDKRRLIRVSMGREPQRPTRDVKAWLQQDIVKKTDSNIYQGYNEIFERDFQKHNKKAEILLNQFTRSRAQPSQAKPAPKSLSVDLVSSLYRCQLLDFDKPIHTLMNSKKQSAMTQLMQIKRWQGQIKILSETRDNAKTLWKEKKNLSERIERISNAISENTYSIEETVQGTPYTMQSLTEEFEMIKSAGFTTANKLHSFAELEQPMKEHLISMQAKSRQALQLLGLTILEARALKNRLTVNSIAELVSAFLDRQILNQQAVFAKDVNECLLNQANTERLIELLSEIIALRDLNEHRFIESVWQSDESVVFQNDNADNKRYPTETQGMSQSPQQKQPRYTKDKIYIVYPQMMTPFTENTSESQLVRFWMGIDKQIAIEIEKVKGVNKLNDLLMSHINYSSAITKQESYLLVNHSLIPQSKLDYINAFIGKMNLDLESLPFYFTQFMSVPRDQMIIQDVGQEKLCREALEVMLGNMRETVTEIILCNIDIDVNAFQALKTYFEHSSVTILDLSLTGINDECLEMLATGASKNQVCALKALYLSSNRLSVQGALRIGSFLKQTHIIGKNLISLDLSRNKIANIGLESICLTLQKNYTLQYLDVSYNQLEDRALYSLADMLKFNTCLHYLSLIGNKFTQRSLFHFANCLSDNEESQLVILRMGTIQCSENEMNDFILRGIQHSNLSFLYIATTANKAKCFEQVNMSDSRLTIWPVDAENASSSLKIRDSFQQFFKNASFDPVQNGVNILRELCKDQSENADKTELMIFVFQMRCTPNEDLIDQTSFFHFSVGQGDIKSVLTCLKQGTDATLRSRVRERLGWSALHIAAHSGHLEIVQLLLNTERLFVTDTSDTKQTPLHCAAQGGHIAICRLLIEYNSPLTAIDLNQQMPLHSCIQTNSTELFRFLERQTDKAIQVQKSGFTQTRALDIQGQDRETPVMQALRYRAQDIFTYLIASECDTSILDNNRENVYLKAVNQKLFRQLALMLHDNRFQYRDLYAENTAGKNALTVLVEQGNLEILMEAQKVGVEIEGAFHAGNTLLHTACRTGFKPIIRYLIDSKLFQIDAKNDSGQTCTDVCLDQETQKYTLLCFQNLNQAEVFGQAAFSSQPRIYRN